MTRAQMEPEQIQTIETEVNPLAMRLNALSVKNQEERSLLVDDIKNAQDLKEKIEVKFHPTANKVKAREVYEATLDTEKAFYEPINAFIDAGKKVVKKYDTDEALRIQREQREAKERQEQQEREAKAKIEAEAKAEQEAEERRQMEEFERLEKEKREKQAMLDAATASGNAKIAGLAAREVARLDNTINEAVEKGEKKIEEIKAKAEAPLPTPMPKFTPPPVAPKKLVWKAKVVNMMKLCRQIAEGNVPFDVVEVNQARLNDFAKRKGEAVVSGEIKVEGLEFNQESTGRL